MTHPIIAASATTLAVIVAIAAAGCSSPDPQVPVGSSSDSDITEKSPEIAADDGSDPESAPLISEQDWVSGRLDAVQGIWGFTADGIGWQNSYDFRQMRGQPAWFGSTGSKGWAGAGQAVPRSVMHELGHSYWGAFPVEGRPDLIPGSDVQEILESYQADLLKFMQQPPDRFEPLRDRFRNLPNLDRGDLPDLAHFGEADLIYLTGGDLDLIPPILRKYYTSYLSDAGVVPDARDWPDALGWWFALDDENRADAGEVFGLQHFPLDLYEDLPRHEHAELASATTAFIDAEEKQRLLDFADQFDEIKERRNALTDATGTDRGFNFWARYLGDLFDLHTEHPGVLATGAGSRGKELGHTLDIYQELGPLSPSEQAKRYRVLTGSDGGGDVQDFAPLLKARTLLELFPAGSTSDLEGIEASSGAYADELRQLVAIADAALNLGATAPESAANELAERLLEFSDDELAGRIDTIFSTMRDAEPEIASNVIGAIPDSLLLRLLDVRPSAARVGEVQPGRLLNAVGVAFDASPNALVDGIALLAENSSGNFAIDAPFDEAVYELLDSLAARDHGLVLRVFSETDLRILPWVAGHSREAAVVLGADLDRSAVLLVTLDGPEPTPERIIRQMAYFDAETAADLMLAVLDVGRGDVLTDTLNTIVYDAYWSGLGAGPTGRLDSAGALLIALRDRVGEGRTAGFVVAGVSDYLSAVDTGDLEAEYRSRHIDTLELLAVTASNAEDRRFFESLVAIVREV
jgi:hypothetical protein